MVSPRQTAKVVSAANRKMACKRGAEQDDPSKVTQKKDEEMKKET
jgi:hypothetical protein